MERGSAPRTDSATRADEERLNFLRECLSKSDLLTEQVLNTLREFETRLETMEQIMEPVHEQTARLKRTHENIINTSAAIDRILSKFNITDEIRARLTESPTAGTGLASFFEALDKVNDAYAFMINNKGFRSAEKCIPTLVCRPWTASPRSPGSRSVRCQTAACMPSRHSSGASSTSRVRLSLCPCSTAMSPTRRR